MGWTRAWVRTAVGCFEENVELDDVDSDFGSVSGVPFVVFIPPSRRWEPRQCPGQFLTPALRFTLSALSLATTSSAATETCYFPTYTLLSYLQEIVML